MQDAKLNILCPYIWFNHILIHHLFIHIFDRSKKVQALYTHHKSVV